MKRERVTAFTDGVFAVIITIMVLELHPPHGASLADLLALWPIFFSYALSFLYVAIYWNNHHHFFHLVAKVEGVCTRRRQTPSLKRPDFLDSPE